MPGSGFRVGLVAKGLGLRAQGSEIRVDGSCLETLIFGFQVSGLPFQVAGFGLGFRV